ncbi:uncharacterized protein SCHCODRAFT_01171201 [Schizophyllum commune H4-8]|nr:uncharacterized protein SCHCODRAFT_01171201 [Schizophyllum commune H4-8]KAI5891909.1 hypothetical protein SCHCODRAFT_01171201 [Schizophyllum commune H4-8]
MSLGITTQQRSGTVARPLPHRDPAWPSTTAYCLIDPNDISLSYDFSAFPPGHIWVCIPYSVLVPRPLRPGLDVGRTDAVIEDVD